MKKILIVSLLLTICCQQMAMAQIHNIKKESQKNKNKSSSSKKNVDANMAANVTEDIVGCCLSNMFSMLFDGCMTAIFDKKTEHQMADNDFDNSYYEEPIQKTHDNTGYQDNTYANTNSPYNSGYSENNKKDNIFSLDINTLFDVSIHKGIDKNFLHIDYLPGLRASLYFIMLDFRYNVLTQPNLDDMDSFKSWELMLLINFTAKRDYSIIIGTGVQREQFLDGETFNEFYGGFVVPIDNKKSYIDISSRFSIDLETNKFPFCEVNGNYNHKILDLSKLSVFATLGLSYQNYYQSYDIVGLRTGLVIRLN